MTVNNGDTVVIEMGRCETNKQTNGRHKLRFALSALRRLFSVMNSYMPEFHTLEGAPLILSLQLNSEIFLEWMRVV